MSEWFSEAAASLVGQPWLQGLLAALATFVLEDPTTIGCGLLVAEGRMEFWTAMIGVSAGIAIGDAGLYGVGRGCGPWVERRELIDPQRMERARNWFSRNLILAMIASRFLPGMRLPAYVGAGMLRIRFLPFVTIAVGASLVWTFLLLNLTVFLGERIFPLLGRLRWPVAILAVLALVLLQRRAVRRLDASKKGAGNLSAPVVSRFEFWPPWLFYIPVALQYAWLALRHRGLLLPTAANPSIHAGGLLAESKSQILDLVPEEHREFVAPWCVIRRPAETGGTEMLRRAEASMRDTGLAYPVVVKPDLGQRGAGIQRIEDGRALERYLEQFPAGAELILQRLAGTAGGEPDADGYLPLREAGVMYWRRPGDEKGSIPSITLKHVPAVVGDGRTPLRRLIAQDSRARHLSTLYFERHGARLERVPGDGEVVPLVFAGNHCQGTVFRNGTELVTPELVDRFDRIARSMSEFWFGRFDVRFDDPPAFFRGEAFQIIEINGAGAEATHIWDATETLRGAYSTLYEQWRTLFEIGAANRRRGHRPQSVVGFLRDVRHYRGLAREYPATH